MLTQEQARERLIPMNLTYVAGELGLHPHTLRRFVKGHKIHGDTLEIISAWLERYEK